MECVVCKITKSWPKVILSKKNNSIVLDTDSQLNTHDSGKILPCAAQHCQITVVDAKENHIPAAESLPGWHLCLDLSRV